MIRPGASPWRTLGFDEGPAADLVENVELTRARAAKYIASRFAIHFREHENAEAGQVRGGVG